MAVRELIPDPFVNTLAAAVSGASSGDISTITLSGTTSWLADENRFGLGTAAFWGYLGNPALPASLEVVRVIQTYPTIRVIRGADGRTPVSHDVSHQFGPALRGSGIVTLVEQGASSSTSINETTVTEQAAILVSAATRIRTPAERLYLFDRFG
jgi:hypothetical protein